MKTHSDDPQLRRLVREAFAVEPTRDPNFRAAVWARIDAAKSTPSTWSAWLRLHVAQFSAVAVMTVVIAGTAGGWIATKEASRNREQLMQRYLASVAPHQQAQ